MKKLAIKSVLFALAGLASVGPAMAQNQNQQGGLTPEHFTQLDRDGSGGVSKAEYEQFMRDSYRKMDANGDQRLTRNETANVLTTEQFDVVDVNKDGVLTEEEFMVQVSRDFDRYDYDKDGVLTR
jgi:Ca2+-binding EF-hand superfamily protein|tara:strand:+ start:154082 stop:154456 length:375 start_codon:yes stop_codon:yes gene_type:complete